MLVHFTPPTRLIRGSLATLAALGAAGLISGTALAQSTPVQLPAVRPAVSTTPSRPTTTRSVSPARPRALTPRYRRTTTAHHPRRVTTATTRYPRATTHPTYRRGASGYRWQRW